MKNTLKKIGSVIIILLQRSLAWLLLSSKNPNEWGLTLKASLGYGASWLVTIVGLTHLHVPGPELVSQVIDAIVAFIVTTGQWVSLAITTYGIVRKLITTIFGSNAVVNEHPAFAEPII